jgi:tetratricopeptide (TPR) repeat protein
MSDWLNAEAHADRALEMFERGRWAEAEAELRKALSLNPDQADWHYNLGMTLEAAGRDPEALASYERAIALAADLVEPLIAAGIVSNRLQRYETAIDWLEQAIAMAPGSEPSYAHLIDALTRLGRHDDAETTFYLAQQALPEASPHCLAAIAESLIERRDFERAGWCLKEALRVEPQMPRGRARLAAVLAATGKPQRALQMYLRDLRDDPGNIDTLLDYGELMLDLGRLPEASEKFRRVLEMEPANVDAHFRLGQIAMTAGRYEQAHLEFELVLKLDPHFPAVRLSVAESLLRRGRTEEARAHLRDELDSWERGADDLPIEPGTEPRAARDERDMERCGGLLLDADMPEAASRVLERAVASGSTPSLLRKLAIARFRSGDVEGGVATSRRVLRQDPSCVASMHNLALAALRAGQLRLASGWIERGLRVERHDDGLRRLRIRLYFAWMRAAALRLIGRR